MTDYEQQQARDRAERLRVYEAAAAQVPQIAAALGAVVAPTKKDTDSHNQPGSFGFTPRWTLTIQVEGREVPFVLMHGGWKKAGKWTVHGAWLQQGTRTVSPRDYGLPSFPEAAIADTKAPDVVARGIQRRFLAEYAPGYLAVLGKIADREAYTKGKHELARKVAERIGHGASVSARDADSPAVYLYSDGLSAHFEGFNPNSGDVSVKLSGASAMRIAAFLAEVLAER